MTTEYEKRLIERGFKVGYRRGYLKARKEAAAVVLQDRCYCPDQQCPCTAVQAAAVRVSKLRLKLPPR